MLTLEIVGLVLCTIIACWASKKIMESVLNLTSLSHNKKTYNSIKKNGMVYNKSTQKLEADNCSTLPFDQQ